MNNGRQIRIQECRAKRRHHRHSQARGTDFRFGYQADAGAREQGEGCVSLGQGIPSFETPSFIREAALDRQARGTSAFHLVLPKRR